jgi:CRISPR-associated protein Cst2
VGVPLKNYTEQYFHVKFDPEGREKSAGQEPRGQGSQVDRQPIFYRPANSGVYALICHMELSRVGVNDITRKAVISNADRQARCRAAIHALLATLVKPSGAQRNTQNPHILDCRGVVATSISYLPAPTVSPLAEDYRQQMKDIAGTLNRISPAAVTVRAFDSLPGGVAVLEEIASGV